MPVGVGPAGMPLASIDCLTHAPGDLIRTFQRAWCIGGLIQTRYNLVVETIFRYVFHYLM